MVGSHHRTVAAVFRTQVCLVLKSKVSSFLFSVPTLTLDPHPWPLSLMMSGLGLVLWLPFGPLAWCRSQGPVPGNPQETAGNQAQAGSLNPLGERAVGMAAGGRGLTRSPAPPLRWLRPRDPVSEVLFVNVSLLRSRVGAGAMDELPCIEAALEQELAELCELETEVFTDIEGACPGTPARPVQGSTSGEVAWPGTSARAHCAVWHLGSRVKL